MESSPTPPQKPAFWRRTLRATLTLTVSLATVAGAGAAVMFGAEALASRAADMPPVDAADATPVAVRSLELQDGYDLPRRFVGQIEAAAEVVMSFELGGRLTMLQVEEGDAVRAGDVIATLDTALLEAERTRLQAARAATRAQRDFAERRLERAGALADRGFTSQDGLDQARATRDELVNRIAELDAALSSVAINLEKSVLVAPFDARVGAQNVDGGEALAGGQPVVTLISMDAPQFRVGLPLGLDTARVTGIDIVIDDRSYPAELVRLRPDIDPVTRTRTALFSLPDANVAFGQTGTLVLRDRINERGAWVPMDALREGRAGTWSVLVVENDTVRVAAVELLHAEAGRAFVRGTFSANAQLIESGAHRVVPGQRVVPQPVTPQPRQLAQES